MNFIINLIILFKTINNYIKQNILQRIVITKLNKDLPDMYINE